MSAFKASLIFRSGLLAALTGLISLIGPFFLSTDQAHAATIVLDPGHGGIDGGAASDNNVAEKQFTLALAKKIAAKLAARHRVELTRSADIALAPADRAAVANHLQADLMISLHAAVAPYCGNRTATLYTHNDEHLAVASGTSTQGSTAESDVDRPAWNKLQIRHQYQSRKAAATIKASFVDSAAFDHVTISGVPLVTLMGADLPAVMIEVGCMHRSVSVNSQMVEGQLNDFAESIAIAIETAISEMMR